MKNIITSIFCLLLAATGFSQPVPTTFVMQDDPANGTDFDLGVIFDVGASGDVLYESSSVQIFVDDGYTGANFTSIQGGTWSANPLIPNSSLMGPCPGSAENYALLTIMIDGSANLGSVVGGQKEDLVTISLTGPGNIAIPVKPWEIGDPLSDCLDALNIGVTNTATIDPDGLGGDPAEGYEDIPGGSSFSLPIELLSFTAKKLNNGSVGLSWSTSSEINSSHFEVEKSRDGFFFEKIGKVKAAGNSNATKDYSFVDEVHVISQSISTFYYRLKMVDLDGASEYSDVRSASFGGQGSPSLSVFPNPATSRLSINTSGTVGEIKVQMTDIEGKLVYKNTIPEHAEIFDIYIDETTLIPGTYVMEFIQGNDVIGTEKVIIMKY